MPRKYYWAPSTADGARRRDGEPWGWELLQTRFRGVDEHHPHNVMAVAMTEEQKRSIETVISPSDIENPATPLP